MTVAGSSPVAPAGIAAYPASGLPELLPEAHGEGSRTALRKDGAPRKLANGVLSRFRIRVGLLLVPDVAPARQFDRWLFPLAGWLRRSLVAKSSETWNVAQGPQYDLSHTVR